MMYLSCIVLSASFTKSWVCMCMTNFVQTTADMTTPRPRYTAQEVAKAFVTKYYLILNKSPEIPHKFYQESSLLGWPRFDGYMKIATTLSVILLSHLRHNLRSVDLSLFQTVNFTWNCHVICLSYMDITYLISSHKISIVSVVMVD